MHYLRVVPSLLSGFFASPVWERLRRMRYDTGMKKIKNLVFVSFLVLVTTTGCVQTDPGSDALFEYPGAGSRLDGYGSGNVRPPENWRQDSLLEREVSLPSLVEYDALPVDDIGKIKRDMTKAELFALLGRPLREDVELQNVDSGGNDYNATVYTWRFMDQRHASQPLMRELAVRLAWVDNARPYPKRPKIMGPDWIVMSWDLY